MRYRIVPARGNGALEGGEAGGARSGVAEEAAARLRAGEVVVHPTSTLYGFGAKPDPALDAELARLKGRDPGGPFIRLAPGAEAVRRLVPAVRWDARAARLADAFWPGPLTLVLEDGTASGLAVRVDGHPLVLEILRWLDGLISSTSVNRSGEAPARDPGEVRRVLDALPDAGVPVTFLDAGPLPPSAPSTVLDVRGSPPRLLRAGAVPVEAVESCLGEEVRG